MNLTCMLIDDEPYAVNLLAEYALQLPGLEVVKKCFNALEALDYLQSNQVDLIFLDINMPKLSGMQLAKILSPQQKLIFTTAHAEFAVESYSVNTIDYLLKPVTLEGFIRAIEKVKQPIESSKLQPAQPALFVKSGKAMIRVSFDEIVFVEGLKDYVIFHTKSSRHIVYKRMKELEQKLPSEFKRIHLSYIINLECLAKVEDNVAYVMDQRLPIGEKYRASFMDYLKSKTM
jgi:two-component system, LytTR family, response regulator